MFQWSNKCVKKKGKLIPKYRWKRDISLHFGLKDPNYIGGARNDDVTRMVQKIIIHHDYDVKGILISQLVLAGCSHHYQLKFRNLQLTRSTKSICHGKHIHPPPTTHHPH